MDKKIQEMVDAGFEKEAFLKELNDLDLMKKYKCFLSKKCNDDKFERIKKMFEFCKDLEDFAEYMGEADFAKLDESYGKKDKRGQSVMIDFAGLTPIEAFTKYKVGVKEVLKKGYILNEKDIYEHK